MFRVFPGQSSSELFDTVAVPAAFNRFGHLLDDRQSQAVRISPRIMCLNAEFLEAVCHPAPGLYRAGLSKRLVQSDKISFSYSNGIFISTGGKI